MSSRCPICKAEILTDEFGLIACPSCGAQIMVGMDDSVEVSPASESAPLESPLTEAEVNESMSAIENPESEPVETPAPRESGDLSDIAEFGNSPLSQARDGSLRFHVHLTNIDTADVRKAVKEILAEPRFLFDVEQIMSSIRDGSVKISDVTPVKAAILIQRLRPLSVGVTWEQYAIHTA